MSQSGFARGALCVTDMALSTSIFAWEGRGARTDGPAFFSALLSSAAPADVWHTRLST